jgi:PAS domain S-box-containing protein
MRISNNKILLLLIFSGIVLIFSAAIILHNSYNRRLNDLKHDTRLNFLDIADSAQLKIEEEINELTKTPQNIALILQNAKLTYKSFREISQNIIKKESKIDEIFLIYDDSVFTDKKHGVSFFKTKRKNFEFFENTRICDSINQCDWVKSVRADKQAVWHLEKISDEKQIHYSASYIIPIINNFREVKGIILFKFKPNSFQKFITDLHISEYGYIIVFSEDGTVIAHPDISKVLTETAQSLSDKNENELLDKIAVHYSKKSIGFNEYFDTLNTGQSFVIGKKLTNNWGITFLFPEDDFIKDQSRLKTQYWIIFFSIFLFISVLIGIIFFTIVDRRNLKLKEKLQNQLIEKISEISKKNSLLEAKNAQILENETQLIQNNIRLQNLVEITEHQKKIITKSENRLQKIINSQGEGFCIIDNDRNFVFTNPAACEIFNVSNGYLTGRNISEFFTEQSFHLLQNEESASDAIEKKTFEAILDLETKNRKTLLITTTPDYDELGNKNGLIAIFRDITELKKQQEELNKLNLELQKYFMVIDQSSVAIIFTDPEGKIEYVNNAFTIVTGYNQNEILGKTPRVLKSGKTELSVYQNLWNTITSGNTWAGVLQNSKKSGEIFIEKELIAPIIGSKKNIVGYVALREDITEKLKIEQEIIRQKEAIEAAHKDITDSIYYAKTIQDSLLSGKDLIDLILFEYFLIFKPKFIVGGDFYYINKIEDRIIIAVGDCTGHGVPGAFMTILGITFLHDIVRKNKEMPANEILTKLRERVKNTFKSFGSENTNGLDIGFCLFDTSQNTLIFAGANIPVFIVRNNELQILEPTKNPIGFYLIEIPFEEKKIHLEENDMIYIATDGYYDQFGGEKNSKFSRKRFKQLLLKCSQCSLSDQKKFFLY